MRIIAHLMRLWLLPMAVGCGSDVSGQLKLMPVSGTVTLDGKAAPGVMLSFIPIGSTHGTGAHAKTDETGKYKLIAGRGGKGAPAGEYRVVADKWPMSGDSDPSIASKAIAIGRPSQQMILPAKYSVAEQTVLKATVREGVNTIDFALSTGR